MGAKGAVSGCKVLQHKQIWARLASSTACKEQAANKIMKIIGNSAPLLFHFLGYFVRDKQSSAVFALIKAVILADFELALRRHYVVAA